MSMTPAERAALKDGDKVIVQRHTIGDSKIIMTVRLTPTQIVAVNGSLEYRFRRTNGSAISPSSNYWPPQLLPYTEEEHLRIRVTHKLDNLSRHIDEFRRSKGVDTLTAADCGVLLHAIESVLVEIAAPQEPAP